MDAPPNMLEQKILAARELLKATKRDLQLVDEQLARLRDGRTPMEPAADVSSEHRMAWFAVADDSGARDPRDLPSENLDPLNGVFLGDLRDSKNYGLANPKTGTARVQEDAAFVCTNVMAIFAVNFNVDNPNQRTLFSESVQTDFSNVVVPYIRLTDGNTGRTLTTGMSEGPQDLGRGVVPLSYLSSFRYGLGSNVKNTFFSEFTIPRAGTVKAEVFNLGTPVSNAQPLRTARVYLTLFGYKVYGA